MNLRPPGPQPGALPDCATPRELLDSTEKPPTVHVRSIWEHMFVPRVVRLDKTDLRSLRPAQADHGLRLASEGTWTARQLLPPCRAAYKQEHYAAHRERYIANAVHRKQALIAERAAYLVEFFRERPCVDCGETDPLVLEFDHLGHKNFNISTGLATITGRRCSTRSPSAT